MQVSISAANWYPISASYAYDNNLSLQPELIKWNDGYSVVYHPIFDATRDITTNQSTILFLTTATSFFNIMNEPIYDSTVIGTYIALKINGLYVTNVSGAFYLSDTGITNNSFFRILFNNDGTCSLMQGNLQFATVSPYLPYGITMQSKIINGDDSTQRFNFYSVNNSQIYITTTFTSPYTAYDTSPIQRFCSYNAHTSAIQCIGMAPDHTNYTNNNNYLFLFEGIGLTTNLNGVTRDQTWISYYNALDNTINNSNTEIDPTKAISGININRLIDVPYFTKININGPVGNMDINIANLKNNMTPEYEYHNRTSIPLDRN